MKEQGLTALKKIITPLTEKLAFALKTARKKIQDKNTQITYKKKLTGFITVLTKRWKATTFALLGFIFIYYGIGATVSSKINKSLDAEINLPSPATKQTTAALAYVLKTQVDDTAWVPALPIIFPAAILDNLPNFQLGVKDSARYVTKKLASFYIDNNLKEAAALLDYPADIWLFSKTQTDQFTPGSAKQYRKAIAEILKFKPNIDNSKITEKQELHYLLSTLNTLLKRRINQLSKQVQEHNTEILDFSADNVFYYTQGTVYTIYYILSAATKDYQDIIVASDQYEHLMSALKYLKDAEELSPVSIQNGAPEDMYTANHLLYLAYYLSEAKNQINQILYTIK